MSTTKKESSRRDFLKNSACYTLGAGSLIAIPQSNGMIPPPMGQTDNLNFIGPKEGYTPQVGTLVSMMNWMRDTILHPVKDLSIEQLDYIHDENSNSIGAMLWHLAATERFYQLNTFDNLKWGDWPKEDDDKFSVAMGLGDKGRKKIKGNKLNFYLDILGEVRENSLKELKNRDDEWLLKLDNDWFWGPTNNYCKWFHVVEHESNHNGQIKYIKSRIK